MSLFEGNCFLDARQHSLRQELLHPMFCTVLPFHRTSSVLVLKKLFPGCAAAQPYDTLIPYPTKGGRRTCRRAGRSR